MTSRERLISAARGSDVDRKPVICWPKACPESDAAIMECADLSALSQADPSKLRLVPVRNPFGQALRHDILVRDELSEDPDAGERTLQGLVDLTRHEIHSALSKGADGILYLLFGAREKYTTPMEYGGHYLERDREILAEIVDSAFRMVFVVGEKDAYLDFVSDLPVELFAWDSLATGVTAAEMRQMRTGALATNSEDANIELRFGVDSPTQYLESGLQIPDSKLQTLGAQVV